MSILFSSAFCAWVIVVLLQFLKFTLVDQPQPRNCNSVAESLVCYSCKFYSSHMCMLNHCQPRIPYRDTGKQDKTCLQSAVLGGTQNEHSVYVHSSTAVTLIIAWITTLRCSLFFLLWNTSSVSFLPHDTMLSAVYSMLQQFRLSVRHTRALYRNGCRYHQNSFTVWWGHHSSFSSPNGGAEYKGSSDFWPICGNISETVIHRRWI